MSFFIYSSRKSGFSSSDTGLNDRSEIIWSKTYGCNIWYENKKGR